MLNNFDEERFKAKVMNGSICKNSLYYIQIIILWLLFSISLIILYKIQVAV